MTIPSFYQASYFKMVGVGKTSEFHEHELITLGAIAEVQNPPLLLANWELSSGHRQIGFDEYKSLLLNPCVTSIPNTMATVFMSLLGNGRDC